MKYSWSAIFPAYNEESNLEIVVEEAVKTLKEITKDYEVIIVDDGSKDRTREIADSLARRYRDIRVFHHSTNLGFGGALFTGYINAEKDLIVAIPSDQQFHPQDLKLYLPFIGEADVVIGCRTDRKDPLFRRVASKFYIFLTRILFGLKVNDINWVKVYKKWIFDKVEIESRGPFIDAELLIKTLKLGGRIKEIEVPHYPRTAGKATGASLFHIFKTVVDLLRLWKKEKKRRT